MQTTLAPVDDFLVTEHFRTLGVAAERFRRKAASGAYSVHLGSSELAGNLARIDLETRSRVNIKDTGAWFYAAHPSTEVLCMCYHVADTEHVQVWVPGEDVPAAFLNPRLIGVAYNAEFERTIWHWIMTKAHGFPAMPAERWICTATMAAYCNLPRSLDEVCNRVGLGEAGKDEDGHANMLKLCKPVKRKKNSVKQIGPLYVGGEFETNIDMHTRNVEYCAVDILADYNLWPKLQPLPKRERQIWLLDQKINDRGVLIDRQMCEGAQQIAAETALYDNARLEDITDGRVTKFTQNQRIRQIAKELKIQLPFKKNSKGKMGPSLNEEARAEILERKNLDPTFREIVEILDRNNSSAVAKYTAALNCAGPDDRCRNQFLYYAAGPGRWGGKIAQFQNFKRGGKVDKLDLVMYAIRGGDYDALCHLCDNRPIETMANVVRLLVCAPPGRQLVISDLSQIEARMLAWMAGEQYVLDLFASGEDIYKDMASKIYGIPISEVTKAQRQVGKVAVLGLGYGCGYVKFVTVAKDMGGVIIDEDTAKDIVDVYRNANPHIRQFWYDVDDAAKMCVRTGKTIRVRCLKFRMEGDWLTIELPTGRKLMYYEPQLVAGGKFGDELHYLDGKKGITKTYGAKLVENIVQAMSRDVLADAMLEMDRLNLYITLHVHDEVHVEILEGDEETPTIVHEIMSTCPEWCPGLPVAAETHTSQRYDK